MSYKYFYPACQYPREKSNGKKFEKNTRHTFNFHSNKGPSTFHKPEINATFMLVLESHVEFRR